MKIIYTLYMACIITSITACTWVSPNAEVKQQGIMVLPQDRVAHCHLLSQTTVSVADKVGFISRMQSDVESDLQTLAMNQAVAQDGDTVSALSPAKDGNQTFGIYKCLGSNSTTTTSAPPASTSIKTTPYQPPR